MFARSLHKALMLFIVMIVGHSGYLAAADGDLDPGFPGPGTILAESVPPDVLALQSDSKLLVASPDMEAIGGIPRRFIARLNVDGTVDSGFQPEVDGQVSSVVLQPDGKILIGGRFSVVNGQSRPGIARLNTDGTLDTTFDADLDDSIVNPDISVIELLATGELIIGGFFLGIGGEDIDNLALVDSTGAVDNSVDIAFNGSILDLAIQSDGKILALGFFTSVAGQSRYRLARFNTDWTLDASFNPLASGDGSFSRVVVDGGDRAILIGFIDSIGGVARPDIARLTTNGSLDASFAPGFGSFAILYDVLIDAAGKIVVAGSYETVNGVDRGGLARLNDDGSLDTTFVPEEVFSAWSLAIDDSGHILAGADLGADFPFEAKVGKFSGDGAQASGFTTELFESSLSVAVRTAAVDDLGRTYIGGTFTSLGGVARKNLARLNADGTLDASFQMDADYGVYDIQQDQNGRFLVAGDFRQIGGLERGRIIRLESDGSFDASFDPRINGSVRTIELLDDGGILVGGSGTFFLALPTPVIREGLIKIGANGVADASFDIDGIAPFFGADINAIQVEADGQIVIGGAFTAIGGESRPGLARLYSDGSLDTSFAPATNNTVKDLLLLDNGEMIVVGDFTQIASTPRNRIAKLDSTGAVLPTFIPDADDSVNFVLPDQDGKLLIGGDFTSIDGATAAKLSRLRASGFRDSEFSASADDTVLNAVPGSGDRPLIMGRFSQVNGQDRSRIARFTREVLAFSLSADQVEINEGDSGSRFFSFTVSPSTDLSGVVTIDFTVTPSGANPADINDFGFTFPLNSSITFDPDGGLLQDGPQGVFLPISGDTELEPDETFTVSISTEDDVVITPPISIEFTILNDEVDSDGDGVIDEADNCPNDNNPGQENTDGGPEGDACDTDDDGDGVDDATDNCPLIVNSAQADFDGDGQGDLCDADQDNDGVDNSVDIHPLNVKVCADVDTDGCDDCTRGIDGFGPLADFNPLNDGPDADGDGQCNISDTDDDGDETPDELDNCPLVANPGQEDSDGDGIGDACGTFCLPIKAGPKMLILCR